MNTVKNNQQGIAHPLLIALVVIVISAIGFAGWRVMNNSSDSDQANSTSSADENLPENLEGLKSIDEVEESLGLSDGVEITDYSLESDDNVSIYVIKLSDGREIKVNAATGELISDSSDDSSEQEVEIETEDESGDDSSSDSSDSSSSSSTKVKASISTNQAYAIAAKLSSSPVKKIEFESEDDKATYKVEYQDGSKVEIDATNGNVIKSEIKSSSESEDDEDDS